MDSDSKSASHPARPLVFGEVLFDAFPGGSQLLGGAPFNVAWHLQGLGMKPLFISRVGTDAAGERVRAAMRDWDMDPSGLQSDDEHPTGIVRVSLERGQPAFDILPAQAYDRIDADEALRAACGQPFSLVYHGTLALREPASRQALRALSAALPAPRCVDLNLRAPWWDDAIVADALDGADWVKLNDAELRAISAIDTIIDNGEAAAQPLSEQAERLRAHQGIAVLVLTLGECGAFIAAPDGRVEGAAPPVAHFVDAVGAGDAFSAVALIGMIMGWQTSQTLARALEFAAWICSVRGATVADRERYAAYRKAWDLEPGDS